MPPAKPLATGNCNTWYANRLQPASELSRQMLSPLRKWQLAAVSQQDDITLIIVDVV